MANQTPTTPPEGVNAPSRRRLLSGAAAAVTGAGFAGVVLSPDLTWGEAELPAGGKLPSTDAALLAAVARGTEIYDQARVARAEGERSFRTWMLDTCHEVVPLDEFIFSTQAVTREGCMAKAKYALKGYKPPEVEGRVGSYHFPYSALHDLYRMTGGTV